MPIVDTPIMTTSNLQSLPELASFDVLPKTAAAPLDGREPQSSRTPLEAITIAINNHMAPNMAPSNKRRRVVDRQYGESLTSVDALLKVHQKETTRKQKTAKKPARPPKQAPATKRYVFFYEEEK